MCAIELSDIITHPFLSLPFIQDFAMSACSRATCSVLLTAILRCSVSQLFSMLLYVADVHWCARPDVKRKMCCNMFAVRRSVLWCGAVCCSILQCVAVCCSVPQSAFEGNVKNCFEVLIGHDPKNEHKCIETQFTCFSLHFT